MQALTIHSSIYMINKHSMQKHMAPRSLLLCVILLSCAAVMVRFASSANFTDLFEPYWAADHIVMVDGDVPVLKLKLDNTSGCGFASKKKYMFGQASMQIKLIEGDSAGTVIAFYMSSDGPNHDELDFEFLGNVSGEPYLIQTNVYANGTGNREQRHSLWFDPTVDFHTYSILWNRYHIRFLVDGIPIRVFVNREGEGIPFPESEVMGVYASVWNADDWATEGGRVKTDWSHAPFIAAFRALDVDAAPEPGTRGWWDAPGMRGLSLHQRRQLKWVRANHLVYDYCKDSARFAQLPRECVG